MALDSLDQLRGSEKSGMDQKPASPGSHIRPDRYLIVQAGQEEYRCQATWAKPSQKQLDWQSSATARQCPYNGNYSNNCQTQDGVHHRLNIGVRHSFRSYRPIDYWRYVSPDMDAGHLLCTLNRS